MEKTETVEICDRIEQLEKSTLDEIIAPVKELRLRESAEQITFFTVVQDDKHKVIFLDFAMQRDDTIDECGSTTMTLKFPGALALLGGRAVEETLDGDLDRFCFAVGVGRGREVGSEIDNTVTA